MPALQASAHQAEQAAWQPTDGADQGAAQVCCARDTIKANVSLGLSASTNSRPGSHTAPPTRARHTTLFLIHCCASGLGGCIQRTL